MKTVIRKTDKIYVAGHQGMAGSAFLRLLEKRGYENLVYRTHAQLDLTQQSAVREFFQKEKPDIVIDAAAKTGGIQVNSKAMADFFYFIGNSDLLRRKKKHMFIEHMLDRTVFQEHKTDGQGFRRYKSLLLQNRHQMGHPHLRNNPYREGHPRSCGECPRMSCPPVDYLYIFCVVSLRLGS